MLSVTESAKKGTYSNLWSESESLQFEHQAALQTLRDKMEAEKHEALRDIKSKLSTEHKDALQAIVQSLTNKHQKEMQEYEEKLCTFDVRYGQEVSKFEEEKAQILCKIDADQLKASSQIEKEKEATREEMKNHLTLFEAKVLKLKQQFKLENKTLREYLIISMTAAVKRREEMHLENQVFLSALEEKLRKEHEDKLEELKINVNRYIAEAIEWERRFMGERVVDLENEYGRLVRQLVAPASDLEQVVESSLLLQKEVNGFPKIIESTLSGVTQQVMAAISSVSEHSMEMDHTYQNEMNFLRKKYCNERVELEGNDRVFGRVRPLIKEDIRFSQEEGIAELDQNDRRMFYSNSKGRIQTDRYGSSCTNFNRQ